MGGGDPNVIWRRTPHVALFLRWQRRGGEGESPGATEFNLCLCGPHGHRILREDHCRLPEWRPRLAPLAQCPVDPREEGVGCHVTRHREAHPRHLEEEETPPIYPHVHLRCQATFKSGAPPGRGRLCLPHHMLLRIGKAWGVHGAHAD